MTNWSHSNKLIKWVTMQQHVVKFYLDVAFFFNHQLFCLLIIVGPDNFLLIDHKEFDNIATSIIYFWGVQIN
jgi:hypothetical protein